MTQYKDLDVRLTAVEGEVRVLRKDAAVALELARGADRDVSEFKATLNTHKALLEALRETQVEQGRKLDGLTQEFRGMQQEFRGMQQEMQGMQQEMRGGFSKLAAGMAQITTLLNRALAGPKSDGN